MRFVAALQGHRDIGKPSVSLSHSSPNSNSSATFFNSLLKNCKVTKTSFVRRGLLLISAAYYTFRTVAARNKVHSKNSEYSEKQKCPMFCRCVVAACFVFCSHTYSPHVLLPTVRATEVVATTSPASVAALLCEFYVLLPLSFSLSLVLARLALFRRAHT